jgi:hypothetical protein
MSSMKVERGRAVIERKRLTKPNKEVRLANFKGRRNKGRPKGAPNKPIRLKAHKLPQLRGALD